MPAGHPGDQRLAGLCGELRRRFRIGHATIQVEVDGDVACALKAPNTV
jgi:cobalt-zinc-cadmium efflux system protein